MECKQDDAGEVDESLVAFGLLRKLNLPAEGWGVEGVEVAEVS